MKRHSRDFEKQPDRNQNEGEDRKKLQNEGIEVQRQGEIPLQQQPHLFARRAREMAKRNGMHQFVALRQCGGDGADVRSTAEPVQNRETVGQDPGAERPEQDIF